MIANRALRMSLVAFASLVAGCGTTAGGLLPWIPQGPGNTPEEVRAQREARARAEPAAPAPRPAEPMPGRRMEVAPDLVAQSPPPPRSAAVQASTPGAAASYTQATRYGDLVFVSGQIALDAAGQIRGATIEEQTRQVMENLRAVLDSHRLNFANVVSVTVYMKELNDFRGMNTVYESYFRGTLPSRSVIEAARLPRGALVEISVIAGR